MLDNSQKGDVIRFQDGGYEVTEVNTRKDGTKELVLTPFEFNEDGSRDYNNSGIKIISEQSIKNGSNLFENAYTSNKGERVIEQSIYEPVATVKEGEVKPTTNEKQSKIPNPPESQSTPTPPTGENVPKAEAGEKGGKVEEKARKIADRIMAANVVPDWLKIDDANAKKSGAGAEDIKKALADATIKMGKLLDKGVEFGEAVKEAVKDLVDMMRRYER